MDFDKINIDGIPYAVKDSEGRQLIAAEADAREEADNQLSQQITKEQTAREEADSQLSQKISEEQSAREQADSQANSDIEALQTDVAELKSKAAIYEPEQNTDISTALNAKLKQNSVVLAPGTYYIGAPITIPNGHALFASGSLLTVTANIQTAVVVGDVLGEGDNSGYNRAFTGLFDVNIDCAALADGIDVNCKTAIVSDFRVSDPESIGLSVYKQATSGSPSDATICNGNIMSNQNPLRQYTYGYYINGTDNNLLHCRTKHSKYGIYQTSLGSALYCLGCHPLGIDSAQTGYAGSVGFRFVSSAACTDCYADNFQYGFVVDNDASITAYYSFNACRYYNYEYNTAMRRYAFKTPTTTTHVSIVAADAPDRQDVYKWYLDATPEAFNFLRGIAYSVNFKESANEPVSWKPDDMCNLMVAMDTTVEYLESRGETSLPVAYFAKMSTSPVVRMDIYTASGSITNVIVRIMASSVNVVNAGKYYGFSSAPTLTFSYDSNTSGCWVYLNMPNAPAGGSQITVNIVGGMPLRLSRRSGALEVSHGSTVQTVTPEK